MSVRSRIEEAEQHWRQGHKERALLAVLSAAHDTARLRYPQAKEACEALALFIAEGASALGLGGDWFDWNFRGGVSLGEVLYDVYRRLLRDGTMPEDVELMPGDQWEIHLLQGNRRGYSDCLVPRLIELVKRAPENVAAFSKRR